MKSIASLTALLLLSACINIGIPDENYPPRLGIGMGGAVLSSPPIITPEENGFTAKVRAGVDQPAGDPTWEAIRQDRIARAVATICPKGMGSLERTAQTVKTIEIGTSRDLTYAGRCK